MSVNVWLLRAVIIQLLFATIVFILYLSLESPHVKHPVRDGWIDPLPSDLSMPLTKEKYLANGKVYTRKEIEREFEKLGSLESLLSKKKIPPNIEKQREEQELVNRVREELTVEKMQQALQEKLNDEMAVNRDETESNTEMDEQQQELRNKKLENERNRYRQNAVPFDREEIEKHENVVTRPNEIAKQKQIEKIQDNWLKESDQDFQLSDSSSERKPKIMDKVHVFYYPWYASDEVDGSWSHWNHNILPHWETSTRNRYPHNINYHPPNDIGSAFYPAQGVYSSSNRTIIAQHMRELKDYLVVLSWWGQAHKPNSHDGEGMNTDKVLPYIFQEAEKHGTQLAFHHEPYKGRTPESVADDMRYLTDTYGHSTSFYRSPLHGNRPLMYLYDSYLSPAHAWASVLKPHMSKSVRGTSHDFVTIGLALQPKDMATLLEGGFDGAYTYFASSGFTANSSPQNWPTLKQQARELNLLLSLSVGPGYDDTRIRPWNAANVHSRQNGKYYDNMWGSALGAEPDFISITSYNEWMEGTSILESLFLTSRHTNRGFGAS